MAQTTGQLSAVNATLEISIDNATWNDISGSANSVAPEGGERMQGEAYTFDGDIPLIAVGKRQPVKLTLRVIYTEVDNEAAYLMDGYYENKTPVYLRYRPIGSKVGGWQFIGLGYILNPVTPATDAESADIIKVEVTWYGTELPITVQSS